MYQLIIAFATQKFAVLKANFSWNITPKEATISPLTKFHKFFKFLQSVRVQRDAFSAQSRMLMRRNVKNDVSKDSPIAKISVTSPMHVFASYGSQPHPFEVLFYSIDAKSSCSITRQHLTFNQAHLVSFYFVLCNQPKF